MKATLVEKLIVQVVGFAQGVILARLLCPEDFGLAAMLGIFLGVGGILAESGLGSAYVVYGGDAQRVFKWNVGVAVIIYAALAIAAPWIAAFYRQPILRDLMWVMGLTVIIYAASVSRIAVLQREKKFRELAITNIAAVVVSFLVGVAMAWGGWGVWSIVGAGLSHAFIRLSILAQVAYATRKVGQDLNACAPRDTAVGISTSCPVVSTSFRALLSYGWKMMASGLIGTVYFHATRLLIGKMFDPAAVGLFHRAHHWATLPGNIVNESVARVALPSLARGETSVKVKGISVKWWMINVFLLWPGVAVLWIWAEEIVGFVLGTQWVECVPYMRILILGAAFSPIANVAETHLKSMGRPDLILAGEFFKKPIQIGALAVGAFYGITGLCWSIVAGEVTSALVNLVMLRRVEK